MITKFKIWGLENVYFYHFMQLIKITRRVKTDISVLSSKNQHD